MMPGNHRINPRIDENGANSCRMDTILKDERIVRIDTNPFSYVDKKRGSLHISNPVKALDRSCVKGKGRCRYGNSNFRRRMFLGSRSIFLRNSKG